MPKAFFTTLALTVVNSLSSSGNWFFRAKVMCPSRSFQVPLRYFVRFFSGASAFFLKWVSTKKSRKITCLTVTGLFE